MNKQPKFDVFMAHNSKDKPQVLKIAEKLKQRGLKPWVDKDGILPGESFQEVIQQAIQDVKSAAIFFGTAGTGKWQKEEISVILSRRTEIPDMRVIPVLLPGVDKLPDDLLFLSQLNWVNFDSSLDDIEALNQLERGIRGKEPDERGENNTTALSSLPTVKSPENDITGERGQPFIEEKSEKNELTVKVVNENNQQDTLEDLTPEQRKELRAALISAFPNPQKLALMVHDELGTSFELITQGQTDYEIGVKNLVEWAEANGKLEQLLKGARTANPGNPKLKKLVSLWLKI